MRSCATWRAGSRSTAISVCCPICITVLARSVSLPRLPRIKAAASLYGVNIVTDKPDSPHLLLDRIESELYFGFAEVDPSVPANVVSELQAALEKTRTKHRLEVFPDTHHGFCFAARADYNAIAAEAAWARVFDLWERNLK